MPAGFDFSKVDITKINSETMSLGTDLQDCALIAQTFERGAHYTANEAAVFAPLSRMLTNTKAFSETVQTSLGTYLQQPKEDANKSVEQANKLAYKGRVGRVIRESEGTSASTDHIMQSFNFGDTQAATHGDNAGETLMKLMKECIPCEDRIVAFLELFPRLDLLASLESDLQGRLGILTNISRLLKDLFAYKDFCNLLDLFSFMCIPDLQKIIMLLAASLSLDLPNLDGLIGLLQALVSPLFSPILMNLSSLMDQFVTLVLSPIDCILDAIQLQMRKINFEGNKGGTLTNFNNSIERTQKNIDKKHDQIREEVNAGLNDFQQKEEKALDNLHETLTSGMSELNDQIVDAKNKIESKLKFYMSQIRALSLEGIGDDTAYILAARKKLGITRMVGLLQALIAAMSQGSPICSAAASGKQPEAEAVNNFIDQYVNPNIPFSLRTDPKTGDLLVDEKVAGMKEAINPITDNSTIGSTKTGLGKLVEYNSVPIVDPSKTNKSTFSTAGGKSTNRSSTTSSTANISNQDFFNGLNSQLLDVLGFASEQLDLSGHGAITTQTSELIKSTAITLATPTRITTRCRLQTTVENAEQVNQWIQELNQV